MHAKCCQAYSRATAAIRARPGPPGAPSRAGDAAPPARQPRIINRLASMKLRHDALTIPPALAAGIKFFRHAHFRAARSRVRGNLRVRGPLDLAREHCAHAFARQVAETSASPCGLPASGNSAPPTGLRKLMWQGRDSETARVPPTLDSPQSAAPETFLSRDAVSAFPLKYGPLPQPLPGVRCCVSAAHARLPWRFFWSPALPRSDRAGRRVPVRSLWFTMSAAVRLSASESIRMSSGPANRNEKPRSAVSSCRLETPRSASTPFTGPAPALEPTSSILEKSRLHQCHLLFVILQSLPRDVQRLRVPIDPDQPPVVSCRAISSAWPPSPTVASTYVPSGLHSQPAQASSASTGVCSRAQT